MAYAVTPHIEASFDPVGTGTPYKVQWVNDLSAVIVAAGWEPEVVLQSGSSGNYYRTVAATVVRLTQNDHFDSFSLFASPPGDPCDGLAAWSIHTTGSQLNVGHDVPPSDEFNCCCLDGSSCPCDPPGSGCGAGTGSLCTVVSLWDFTLGTDNAGFLSNHNDLVTQVFNNTSPTVQHVALFTNTTTNTAGAITLLESYHAVWEEGGTTSPLQGALDVELPSIGAAFNSSATRFHGGWVLHSQESNTPENKSTIYIGVDREAEGPGDIVAATFPFVYSFSTYTAQTHPLLYIGPVFTGTLSGIAHRTLFRNEDNDMRIIANPYHVHMYSHLNGTALGTGSLNTMSVGALRTVPLNGEDPALPATWDFRKAVFHAGQQIIGLEQQNWINPSNNSWYMTIDDAAGTDTNTTAADDNQLNVGGFHWWDRTRAGEAACTWISGEAFYCEPWAGFNSGSSTAELVSPVLGQLWDCITPSKPGGSGYFFWDGEWWTHWQVLRTNTGVTGGPNGNLSFRVGFQTLEGEEPILGVWIWPVDPRDVMLYSILNDNIIAPFPWGNMTGLSISNGTFVGGTTTRTLTATCTAHPDADDGTKLVAIHSPRGYFTFTPEVISISSGATTGTSLVHALSPGLGGVTATIYADSITQVNLDVTVND